MLNPYLSRSPKDKHIIKLFNPCDLDAKNSYLKPITLDDVDDVYLEGINNVQIRKWLAFTNQEKSTLDKLRSYVTSNLNNPKSVLFGFFLDEKLCGTVRLHNISSGKADIGIVIFDLSIWGKSWATVILQTVTDFAFNQLDIVSLNAGIDKNNIGSLRAFSKAGFERLDDNEITYDMGSAIILTRNYKP